MQFCQLLLAAIAVFLMGCPKSPTGTVSETVTIHAPTFGGQPTASFVSQLNAYDLVGECDVKAKGLEHSFNQSVWMEVVGGCSAGSFTISMFVISVTHVYVRSRTDGGTTASAHAIVKWGGPTGTFEFQLVSSGQIDPDGAAGTQSMTDHSFIKATMTNGATTIKPSMIDAIYGP